MNDKQYFVEVQFRRNGEWVRKSEILESFVEAARALAHIEARYHEQSYDYYDTRITALEVFDEQGGLGTMDRLELILEAKNDIHECIEWIGVEMNNPIQTPMQESDWNWILARLKSARTLLVNLEKQEG